MNCPECSSPDETGSHCRNCGVRFVDTARLIITLDCNRKCHYCCNTPEMLASATKIKDLSELDDYKEILITGGEPMLNPERTLAIVQHLNHLGKVYWDKHKELRKIYLYTALAADDPGWLYSMLFSGLDGIHYTLHYNCTAHDRITGIEVIEDLSKEFPTSKSFRLYMDSEVEHQVTIIPQRWSRIQSFKFIEDCPLPENEKLFILEN